ncbi:MalM family protein [Psychromonas arctica]|uniref:MalM family protein n=1 Tax=Psychromonas arctica TaxID=168275 RepID=UPI000424A102|nr:MalM family protein [Psychromonas arctica]
MKKWIAPIILSTLIVGCAKTQTVTLDVPQENKVALNISEITWSALDIPTDIKFSIDKSNQLLLNGESAGPIASFTLPGNKGSLDIEIESFVDSKNTFYAPNIVILNKAGDLIDQKPFSDFTYEPAKLLDNDKFTTKFNIMPDMSGDNLKLLVFTTAKDLAGSTPVLHPAKAFAIAKHTVQPIIDDPLAKHVAYGNLSLTLTSNQVVTTRIINTSDNIPAGINLESFYRKSIQNAVANEDIPKALKLLEEAKNLQVEGAQTIFVDAINSYK